MQSLSGTWKLAIDPTNVGREKKWFEKIQKEAEDAPVPGLVQQVFPEHHGVSWYWYVFRPELKPDRNNRCLLRFGAVHYLSEVWLNGIAVGGHEGGETPFNLDVTEALRPGTNNLLAVRVVNLSNTPIDGMRLSETPNGMNRLYGGFILPVELLNVPIVRIDDIFVQPRIATGDIDVTVKVVNDTGTGVRGKLLGSTGPEKTGEVSVTAGIQAEFPTGESTHRFTLTIKQHRLWSLDDPQLYRMTVVLEACGEDNTIVRHEKSLRCGFRDFKVVDGFFYLNGKRIFLRSVHTCAWFPVGGPVVDLTPAFSRRDLILAKACGFNMVRYLAGLALPEQLDCCDEIGLMIYEEPLASWNLDHSPKMTERYDRSLREMIVRDRNHPSITIWGLLNETPDGPVFRHAVDTLPLVRSLDETRLVLLGSGRWDCQPSIGSLSNPGSDTWEYEWGIEGPNAKAVINTWDLNHGGYFDRMGDAHAYPGTPHPPITFKFLRTLGHDTKPVFLSEYGIGSVSNVIRELRHYEQAGMRPDLSWAVSYRNIMEKFLADWKRFGMDGVYPFPEDMLLESQRLHARQRLLGFDLIRSNPKICGFNLTSMLDHPGGGEGVWTFWREFKPGIADALSDGWAPLRWCLFVDPLHGYTNQKFKVEAVLANEDVLGPGEYPVSLCISGPTGTVWKKKITLQIPKPKAGTNPGFSVPVFSGTVVVNGPSGEYTFAANLEQGGAPAGGRLKFRLTDRINPTAGKTKRTVVLWGVEKRVENWLTSHGLRCRSFKTPSTKKREVILVGNDQSVVNNDPAGWRELARRMACGSTVVFLSPLVFDRGLQTLAGNLQRKGFKKQGVSIREFQVGNVPKDEQACFKNEFYGQFSYLMSDIPDADHFVELGMCEGCYTEEGKRLFDVQINGKPVLRNFDILKEAGGDHLAVIRRFKVRPKGGKIDIQFIARKDSPSLSRLRIFDQNEKLMVEDNVAKYIHAASWLPLVKKGRCYEFADWLYHKECVAKTHPIFDGLQTRGIMDWDYYGPIIPHYIFDGQDTPDDVPAAAFAVGYLPGNYASGVLVGSYTFGAGRFILNTPLILENIDIHPAADRLLLNMINYAASFAKGPAAPLPKNFEKTLKTIGYLET
jgi:hypothetical protein